MKLLLSPLPATLRGIYDVNRDGARQEMPARALYAHPDLARAILQLERDGVRLVYSDIFRSAETSLRRRRDFEAANERARREGRPPVPQLAKRPGESPHNFGLSIDIDVAAALRELRLSKPKLDAVLARYGLYCHRRDGRLAAECWHYNAIAPEAARWLALASNRSTSRAVEAKIQALYGGQFKLTRDEQIAALRRLNYAPGDGTVEHVTQAVRAFQRDWGLAVDGIAGPKTQRLLAYLTAEVELIDP